jgi:hypothetical protein
MISNQTYTLYKVSEDLYGVSTCCPKLNAEINRLLKYKTYPKGTRFKEGEEPLFHFNTLTLPLILKCLGLPINVVVAYPAVA